jgi:hypothetical protein
MDFEINNFNRRFFILTTDHSPSEKERGRDMLKITIDQEFARLVPKLADEEYSQLEKNIIKDGCREPLSLWQGILLDGHNRHKICQKHNIQFETVEIKLGSRDAAKEWIIRNQLGRRNLTDYQRGELVLHLETQYAVKAKKRKLAALKQGDQSPVKANLPERGKGQTRDAMAKLAGVGARTYDKIKVIDKEASEEEKEDLRKGKTSINKVYSGIQREKGPGTVKEEVVEGEVDITLDKTMSDDAVLIIKPKGAKIDDVLLQVASGINSATTLLTDSVVGNIRLASPGSWKSFQRALNKLDHLYNEMFKRYNDDTV